MPAPLTADDIPGLIESPDFAALPHEQRLTIAEDALASGAQSMAGKWDKDTYQKWGQFAQTVRGQVAGMEGFGDAAKHYGGVVLDAGRGMARMAVAAAGDLSATNPDGSLRMPGGNILQQGGYWLKKAADSADVMTSGDRTALDTELETLKKDLDEGNMPLDDPAKLGDWVEARASKVSQAQKSWYDSAEGTDYPAGYEETNGLLNPDHAALLSRYLQTRDPAVWDSLTKGLARTPRRSAIEFSQQEALQRSPIVSFMSEALGTDYGEAMAGAGDPLLLALTALPLARGAAGALGVTERTGVQVAKGFAKSGAIAGGLGVAEQAVAEPGSSWDDYKRAAKDMLAVGLGFHGIGEAAGSLAKRALAKRQAAAEAAQAAAIGDAAPIGTVRNPFEGPIEAPPQPLEGGGFADAPRKPVRPEVARPEEFQSGLTEAPAPDLTADVTRGLEVRRAEAVAEVQREGLPADQAGAIVEAGRLADEATATKAAEVDLFGNPIEPPAATSSLGNLVTEEVPINQLALSKDVPQFKSDANAAGVVEPLEGGYQRLGTGPILVWERMNGQREVISGRHRFDLAKRTGEATIPAQVVREADGFSLQHALTADAELNIRDGQGKVKDYANYFRNAGIDAAEAEARGLRARSTGRTGWTIGTEASEAVYELHANGRLTDAQAEAVARVAPGNEALQRVGVQAMLVDKLPIDVSTHLMRAMDAELGGVGTANQMDLFGANDSAMQAMKAQARKAAEIQRGLREQVAAVQGAAKRPERAREMGVDVADPEGVKAAVQELKTEIDRWDNWPLHEDLRARVRGEIPRGETRATPEADGALNIEVPFDLEAVSPEQLAAEQNAQAQRQAIEARQQRPLQGNAGEFGTPDMLDNTAGPMALFGQAEKPRGRAQTAEPADAALSPRFQVPASSGPLPTTYGGGAVPSAPPTAWSGTVRTLHGIRANLLKAAGMGPVGVGRFAKALGIYRLKPETIRLQAINDIPVLAHEIGHAIHYRELSTNRGGPADAWGGVHDGELLKLGQATSAPSYTGAMVRKEGVAEFTRLWLTDPAKARAEAPVFSAFWEKSLETKNPKMAQALRDARAEIADYIAMPAFQKAKAQVVFDPATEQPRATARQWLGSAYAKWVNTIQPALNVLNDIAKAEPGRATEAKRIEAWMENHRGGWASKAWSDIFGRQTDLTGNRVGAGMAEILKGIPGGEAENFSTYLALKRAAEIERSGRRSGFENARLPRAEMRALERKFEATRQKLQAWSDNSLQMLVDSGLLDAKTAHKMRIANQDYVPFYRLYERVNGVSFGPEGSRNSGGYVDLRSGIHRLKGSDRAIVDPLQSLMKNAYMFRKIAEQNHIGVQFFDLLSDVQGHGKWGEQIRPKTKVTEFGHDKVVQKLIDEGVINSPADLPFDADLTLRLMQAMEKPDSAKGEVIVFKNGKRQHWEVRDPLLLEALKTADADAVKLAKFVGPTWAKALTMPTRVLRWGATGGPWFAIPNFIRDQFTAGIQSKAGYIPFVDGVRGMLHVIRKSDVYRRWEEAGGKFHGVTTGTQAFTALLEDALPKDMSARQMALDMVNPRNLLRALSYAGQLTEEATRVAEFARNVARGASDMDAANASKIVSLNFARAGERGRVANMLIAFTNAKIQELDLVAGLHMNPGRRGEIVMKGLMYITAPSLATWWLGKDDPDIQALPDWRKNMFWNVNMAPVARALGRDGFILSVPKPFLMGAMYGTTVERALDFATGRDPNGARKAVGNLMSNAINPMDMVTSIAGLKPIIEASSNYDAFRGRPIVPEAMKFLPKEQQYDLATSETAKLIGKYTHTSPMMIDHLVSGYLATAGKWGTGAIDWGLQKLGAADVPVAPTKDLMEMPVLNRFAGSPYAANAWVERFYKASGDMEGKLQVWNKQTDQMSTADQKRWWESNGPEIQHYERTVDYQTKRTAAGDVRKAMAAMSELTGAMKDVQASRVLSPDQKRARLMDLTQQRNDLAEQGFKALFPEQVRRRHY